MRSSNQTCANPFSDTTVEVIRGCTGWGGLFKSETGSLFSNTNVSGNYYGLNYSGYATMSGGICIRLAGINSDGTGQMDFVAVKNNRTMNRWSNEKTNKTPK